MNPNDKKVLVVDDDADILESLNLVLESEGFQVETLSKGDQVIEKIKEFNPDVILLDLLLSGKDGRVICQQVRKTPSISHKPIVIMSAHPSLSTAYKDAGATAHLSKPFEIDDLLRLVQTL